MNDLDDGSKLRSLSLLGARLKTLRVQLGYSQRELARRAGMTHGSLSHIEQGHVSPSVHSLEKILQAMSISLNDFFCDASLSSPVMRQSALSCVKKDSAVYSLMPIRLSSTGDCLVRQVYQPGAQICSDWLISFDRVAGLVVAGELQLILCGTRYSLSDGDGFEFATRQEHVFENVSTAPCIIISANFREDQAHQKIEPGLFDGITQ